MFYTYILERLATPGRCYIGHTADLRRRLFARAVDAGSHPVHAVDALELILPEMMS